MSASASVSSLLSSASSSSPFYRSFAHNAALRPGTLRRRGQRDSLPRAQDEAATLSALGGAAIAGATTGGLLTAPPPAPAIPIAGPFPGAAAGAGAAAIGSVRAGPLLPDEPQPQPDYPARRAPTSPTAAATVWESPSGRDPGLTPSVPRYLHPGSWLPQPAQPQPAQPQENVPARQASPGGWQFPSGNPTGLTTRFGKEAAAKLLQQIPLDSSPAVAGPQSAAPAARPTRLTAREMRQQKREQRHEERRQERAAATQAFEEKLSQSPRLRDLIGRASTDPAAAPNFPSATPPRIGVPGLHNTPATSQDSLPHAGPSGRTAPSPSGTGPSGGGTSQDQFPGPYNPWPQAPASPQPRPSSTGGLTTNATTSPRSIVRPFEPQPQRPVYQRPTPAQDPDIFPISPSTAIPLGGRELDERLRRIAASQPPHPPSPLLSATDTDRTTTDPSATNTTTPAALPAHLRRRQQQLEVQLQPAQDRLTAAEQEVQRYNGGRIRYQRRPGGVDRITTDSFGRQTHTPIATGDANAIVASSNWLKHHDHLQAQLTQAQAKLAPHLETQRLLTAEQQAWQAKQAAQAQARAAAQEQQRQQELQQQQQQEAQQRTAAEAERVAGEVAANTPRTEEQIQEPPEASAAPTGADAAHSALSPGDAPVSTQAGPAAAKPEPRPRQLVKVQVDGGEALRARGDWAPHDVEPLFDDPQFKDASPEHRQQVLSQVLGSAARTAFGDSAEPSTEEAMRARFIEFHRKADAAREKLAGMESWGEKAKHAGGVVMDTAVGAARSLIAGSADLSLKNPDGSWRMPGGNTAKQMDHWTAKTQDSLMVMDTPPEAVNEELAALQKEIKQGRMPMKDPQAAAAWLEEWNQRISASFTQWADEQQALRNAGEKEFDAPLTPPWPRAYAETNGLLNHNHAALLRQYIETGDPQAWHHLTDSLLKTPWRAQTELDQQQSLKDSPMVGFLTGLTGHDYTDEFAALGDPIQVAATLWPAGRGFKAAGIVEKGGGNALVKGFAQSGAIGGGLAVINTAIENPNARWEDYKQNSKDMIIGALGMHAGGLVVGKVKQKIGEKIDTHIAARNPHADPSPNSNQHPTAEQDPMAAAPNPPAESPVPGKTPTETPPVTPEAPSAAPKASPPLSEAPPSPEAPQQPAAAPAPGTAPKEPVPPSPADALPIPAPADAVPPVKGIPREPVAPPPSVANADGPAAKPPAASPLPVDATPARPGSGPVTAPAPSPDQAGGPAPEARLQTPSKALSPIPRSSQPPPFSQTPVPRTPSPMDPGTGQRIRNNLTREKAKRRRKGKELTSEEEAALKQAEEVLGKGAGANSTQRDESSADTQPTAQSNAVPSGPKSKRKKRAANTTRTGGVRKNAQDWRKTRDLWDELGYGELLSKSNRKLIGRGRTPVVDNEWIALNPEDAGLRGELINMHHIRGLPITQPLPESRHKNSHMPGGFRYNSGGPGSQLPIYPAN